jgi:hypothetical protein
MTANKCINIIIHLRNVDLLSETDDETTPYRQKILAFLNDYLSVLYTEVPKGWLKSYNYFDFLKWFTCTNDTSKRFCFERDIICQLVDLLLEKKSPIRTVEKKYDLYIKSCTQSLGPIIQTIVNLVSASHNELAAKREPEEKFLHVLTENERKCLTSIDFYRLVLENYKQDIASLSYLIVRFCTNNAGLSEGIAALLVHSINQSEGYESALCCMGVNCMLIVAHPHLHAHQGRIHSSAPQVAIWSAAVPRCWQRVFHQEHCGQPGGNLHEQPLLLPAQLQVGPRTVIFSAPLA